ncbi:collagen-like protein [Crocinitomicaceae bacterium]|nr:collagen-like protein [Crocinitomicaceae bacterium]
MKKTLFTFFTIIGLTLSAQQEAPPQGINYQAVVYSDNGNNQPGLNSPGQVLWNEDIGVQFSILSSSATGNVIYKETHATSTDEFGMFDLVIGQGLVQGTQAFNMIDWGSGYHFLKVEVDKTGGTFYVEMSNQQLWSVPYALYSGYSSSSGYADSSAYADVAGNGLTGVADNGDGTLTFTYYDGSTYTTTVLSGLGGVGPQGPAGADGQDGQDGLSAYEIWLSQGNTGTESDFLNSLEGPQGPAGTNGVDGVDGATGAQGPQGLPGNDGATGPQGPAGADGLDGQDGLSAYEIWLSQGNTGTEQDFLDSLQATANTDWNSITNIPSDISDGDDVDDADNDPTNEIETWTTLVGIPTGFVDDIDDVDDADNDPTNELQVLSTSGDTIFISNGNYIVIPGLVEEVPTTQNGSLAFPLPFYLEYTGDCSNGSFNSSGNTTFYNGVEQYCNYTLNLNDTLFINDGINPFTVTILAQDTVFIHGVIDGTGTDAFYWGTVAASVLTALGGGGGGSGDASQCANGGRQGWGTSVSISAFNSANPNLILSGAGGSGLGGAAGSPVGGNGGSISSTVLENSLQIRPLLAGARGNATNSCSGSSLAGKAGTGGSGLYIICRVLVFDGQINLNGGDGGAGLSGGGGGGGGGCLVISSDEILDQSGAINTSGGLGGSSNAAGGNGGDGAHVIVEY